MIGAGFCTYIPPACCSVEAVIATLPPVKIPDEQQKQCGLNTTRNAFFIIAVYTYSHTYTQKVCVF